MSGLGVIGRIESRVRIAGGRVGAQVGDDGPNRRGGIRSVRTRKIKPFQGVVVELHSNRRIVAQVPITKHSGSGVMRSPVDPRKSVAVLVGEAVVLTQVGLARGGVPARKAAVGDIEGRVEVRRSDFLVRRTPVSESWDRHDIEGTGTLQPHRGDRIVAEGDVPGVEEIIVTIHILLAQDTEGPHTRSAVVGVGILDQDVRL